MSISILNVDSARSPISDARLADLVHTQRVALRERGVPSLTSRARTLRQLGSALDRYSSELFAAITADFGSRSTVETWLYDIRPVKRALSGARRRLATAEAGRRILGRAGGPRIQAGSRPDIAAHVPAWQFPIAQSLVPLVNAVADGSRVVLALPHQTRRTSDVIKRLLGEIFEAEHVVAVTGGDYVASSLARLDLDRLYASIPWSQARSASLVAGSGLVPLSLAVQARNAAVVARGYSLDHAAQQIVRAKLLNAGQHPSAPDIVYVPRGSVDIFLGYARHAVAAMYPTLLDNPDFGAMVSQEHAEFVRDLVEDAIDRGAQIIRINPGGESFAGQTRKIVPTLIVEVGDEMAVLRQPVLGPVLAVRAYRSFDEIIELSAKEGDLGSICWFDTDPLRASETIPRLSPRRAWLNSAPPLGPALSTILPPVWTGEDIAFRETSTGSSRDVRTSMLGALVEGSSVLVPPYGNFLRAFARWKLNVG